MATPQHTADRGLHLALYGTDPGVRACRARARDGKGEWEHARDLPIIGMQEGA